MIGSYVGGHKPNPYVVTRSWGPKRGALSPMGKRLTSTGPFLRGEATLEQLNTHGGMARCVEGTYLLMLGVEFQ